MQTQDAIFATAVIDETKPLTESEARIASCVEFVADKTIEAIFYIMTDWATRDLLGQPTASFRPKQARVIYFSKAELMWKDGHLDHEKVKVYAPYKEVVVSNSPTIRKGVLEQQGLNATTAILILAAAGIEVILPNVSLNRNAKPEIHEIKEKLAEERNNYLVAVTKMADESFSRLKSGDLKDIYDWAKTEATLKIQPKARLLQNNLKKLNSPLLHRAGVSFWQDSVPAIGQALVNDGAKGATKTAAIELIKLLSTTLAKRIEERQIPEAAYSFKLSKELI